MIPQTPLNPATQAGGDFNGFTIGVVTDNEDPESLGRVKVQLPVLGESFITDWLRVCSIAAGGNRGVFFLPHVEDEVLVGFLNGNPNQPIVVGLLWNGRDRPPVPGEEQQVVSEIRTETGKQIVLKDGEDSGSITITDEKNNQVVIDTASGNISIKAEGDISIETPEGALSLTAASISIKAEGAVSIEGGDLNLTGSGDVNVSGALINLN